jgi:hypothetical protein
MICAWDRGSIEEERENWKDDVMRLCTVQCCSRDRDLVTL